MGANRFECYQSAVKAAIEQYPQNTILKLKQQIKHPEYIRPYSNLKYDQQQKSAPATNQKVPQQKYRPVRGGAAKYSRGTYPTTRGSSTRGRGYSSDRMQWPSYESTYHPPSKSLSDSNHWEYQSSNDWSAPKDQRYYQTTRARNDSNEKDAVD